VNRFNSAVLLAMLALASASAVAAMSSADSATASEANMNLGIAYLKTGNLPLAKEKLERARDQSPRNGQVRGAVALLYARLGDDARADSEFNNALKFSKNDPEQQNNYAVFLCSRGRYVDGVKHFEQAAANPLYRTPWSAYTNAGVCLRSAKQEDEAAARFTKALSLRPDYAEATYQLADLELTQHHAADAFKRVDTYLARYPANADLLFVGWRAAREQNDPVAAFRMARRLQADFSGSEQARAASASAPGTSAANGR
jgi:type IV pilus assembly protein PilF